MSRKLARPRPETLRSAAPWGLAALVVLIAASVALSLGDGDDQSAEGATSTEGSKTADALVPLEQHPPGTSDRFIVFLKDGAGNLSALRDDLSKVDQVESIRFASKAENLRDLEERVDDELAESINELNNNPLPRSLTVDTNEPVDVVTFEARLLEAAGRNRDAVDTIESAPFRVPD